MKKADSLCFSLRKEILKMSGKRTLPTVLGPDPNYDF